MQSMKERNRKIGYIIKLKKKHTSKSSVSNLVWGTRGGGGAVSTLETATSSAGADGSGSSLNDLVSSEGPSSGLYVNWSCNKMTPLVL